MPIYIDIDPSYTPQSPIGMNAKATINITPLVNLEATDGAKLNEAHRIIFYTEATPLYASVDYILLKAGEVLSQLPEAAIYIMSFIASTMVEDMLLFDVSSKFPDTTTQEYLFFNRARVEFAACTAIQNLLRGIITSKGTNVKRKALADFSIDTGSLANLLQTASKYLRDMQDECARWRAALYACGSYDYMMPAPLAGVKSGSNYNDSAIGIGRGWEAGGLTLNRREKAVSSGNSWSRPSRYSDPRYYTTVVY